ncbi:glycogen synthase GlgA [Enterococcus sp. BWB1-3]|uniref:glycogen synthase GlgA n=1 Tax=unclassified Enterococcus TaxID=2608891 RepID=UPI001921279F|nr:MULTISPECIES: glycogen synthase GlgA [unclassified Enterococcus]MBL1229747.1 glycogen synthase GlgA [Enterococcus sp. BWB1-3]MCB5953900.1 glycogen synthase GlgA [Enterococcus sp. CWB-B31]
MKVLFTAAECAPFFKTGGLGDVAGALPKQLKDKGADIRIVLPYYKQMPTKYQELCEDVFYFYVNVGWRRQYCGIKKMVLDGLTYYFIDNQYYFDRDGLYGYYDDGERFAYFQLAVIEMMEKIDFIPDIIHVNDYHTAMIPFLIREKYYWIQAYQAIETVLTIHNIEFQGVFGENILSDLFGMGKERYYDGTVRFDDNINFLKTGILYAGRVNTVSPSYAEEIQTPEFGSGLDGVLRMAKDKLSGILNGINYEINDPETDPLIPANFSKEDLTGKATNKAALQQKMGLPIRDVPLMAIVSRLTHQKGFQLLMDEMEYMMQDDVQLVVLGTGEAEFEQGFKAFVHRFPEKCAVSISFDVKLAQLFYAGADLFLMPSAFEPCGLSQMISMRYGTLPVVHEIGGLKDSVIPYNPITKEGTGFGFSEFRSVYLMETIRMAAAVYREEPEVWQQLIQTAMAKDFSWDSPAKEYIGLYQLLTER